MGHAGFAATIGWEVRGRVSVGPTLFTSRELQVFLFRSSTQFNDALNASCVGLKGKKSGKVSLGGGIHLAAVEHDFGIFPVGHFLLRERGMEDILG